MVLHKWVLPCGRNSQLLFTVMCLECTAWAPAATLWWITEMCSCWNRRNISFIRFEFLISMCSREHVNIWTLSPWQRSWFPCIYFQLLISLSQRPLFLLEFGDIIFHQNCERSCKLVDKDLLQLDTVWTGEITTMSRTSQMSIGSSTQSSGGISVFGDFWNFPNLDLEQPDLALEVILVWSRQRAYVRETNYLNPSVIPWNDRV